MRKSLACVRALIAGLVLMMSAVQAAHAQGFWRAIDTLDEREDSGIYSRSSQKRIDLLAIGSVAGLALFEGTETRLGKTAWHAVDAAMMTAGTTELMKRVFQRPRPVDNSDPSVWFAGSHNRSFPSGEVAMMAAFTSPFILEYMDDHPAVWALMALPAYMGSARMASQAHWLTDVVAGAAIGTGIGYYAWKRDVPLVLAISGRSTFIGLHYRF